MTLRVAVLASGRGSNFEVLADRTATEGPGDGSGGEGLAWEVGVLITDRPGIAVLERAREREIPAEIVEPRPADPERAARTMLEILESHAIGIVVLAGYLRLVPAAVVDRFRGRMLNIHPALLPAFGGKGMYGRRVHEAVIASGARVSGVTIHFVDEAYDEGRILAQWPVPVLPGDDPGSLAARIHEVEHRLYPAAVSTLARAVATNEEAGSIPTEGRHFHLRSEPPTFPGP